MTTKIFIFRVNIQNTKNIEIDQTIPTCNADGWYTGNNAEWNKYIYKNDFLNYLNKISQFKDLN